MFRKCFAEMASVKIVAGQHPDPKDRVNIYIRIVHNRCKAEIAVPGLRIHAKNWHPEKYIKKAEPGVENYIAVNEKLTRYEANVMKIINNQAINDSLQVMDVKQLAQLIKDRLFNAQANILSVDAYFSRHIERLLKTGKTGNAKVYEATRRFIATYAGNIALSELSYRKLIDIETNYFSQHKRNGKNGFAVYMRTLRSLVHMAIHEGVLNEDRNPFKHYRIKLSETRKRAITLDELRLVRDAQLHFNKKNNISEVQKLFMLQFFLAGINFKDLMQLKKSDIVNGYVKYTRSKTGIIYSIKLNKEAIELINYFSAHSSESFIIGNRYTISYYDHALKKISHAIGISHLSSNTPRHTWASLARKTGEDISVISQTLGHRDIKTTQIYLDTLDNSVVDKATDRLANMV